MGELSLSREGYTSYLGVPEQLRVQLGDDVVVKCSASSSEEPNFFWKKDVRKPRDCAHTVALSSLCFWKLVILPPSTFVVTSLFLPSLSRSLFLSWLSSKHSYNFLSSSSTVSLLEFLQPLVSPRLSSSHAFLWRSALYLSDRLA